MVGGGKDKFWTGVWGSNAFFTPEKRRGGETFLPGKMGGG